MRGEEIMSGAQRIHDAEFLTERAKAHGIGMWDSIVVEVQNLLHECSKGMQGLPPSPSFIFHM